MSTELGRIREMDLPGMGPGLRGDILVTRFVAGHHGIGHQLTIGGRYVQLDIQRTMDLATLLIDSLTEVLKNRADRITSQSDLEAVLRELLDHGSCYHSAIELDHGFSGERWERKVLDLLGEKGAGG